MPKQYLRMLYRKFRRSGTVSSINLVGLSGGLACGLLIYLWIYDELHVDKFYPHSDRMYSVMINDKPADRIVTGNQGSVILGRALKNSFPDVEYAKVKTPAGWFKSFNISYTDKGVVKGTGNFVSKDFFHVFSRQFLSGDINASLSASNSIVISKGLAEKLFHNADEAVGKRLQWKSASITKESVVTGVYEDFPANSTAHFDFVLPMRAWDEIINANDRTELAVLSKITHICVYVLNQESAFDFYTNKLGCKVKMDVPMGADARWLTVTPPDQPDFEITLFPLTTGRMFTEGVVNTMKEFVSKGIFGPGIFSCNDIFATYEELKSKGVEFIKPPTKEFYGTEALFKDDSGNWFSLQQK